ncbi:MAG: hypothetical protein J4473_03025 [Candidatus Aenigmarchaeota archaeon]|nr:hypothetical protein [Candidatus Aenigmarchaeota archaeon]
MDRVSLLGIWNNFIKEDIFDDAYTCEIGFYGPLYTGTERTRNKLS